MNLKIGGRTIVHGRRVDAETGDVAFIHKDSRGVGTETGEMEIVRLA